MKGMWDFYKQILIDVVVHAVNEDYNVYDIFYLKKNTF